jgi:hypothetical protein
MLLIIKSVIKIMSGILSYISRFTRPSDTITDKQVNILLDAPGVTFPARTRERLKFYINKNWATRPGKKSAFDLFKEANHKCTYEFFNKLIKGDESNKPFEEKINEKLEDLNELDPTDPTFKQSEKDIKTGIEIQYKELSKFFTEGFSSVFKDNLLFNKNGKPIAVREGNDRQRMEQCHDKLTEDVYEQSSRRIGPDEESEGVAGKAFEGQYGNPPEPSGKGRKRTRKQKQKKRSKRKTYKYK